MVSMSSPSQPPLPTLPAAPPPPPVFGQAPQGSKPGRKPSTPSFLNSSALPADNNVGAGKALTGQ